MEQSSLELERRWRVLQESRRPREFAVPIGKLLKDYGRARNWGQLERLSELRSAIDDVVDDRFRRHCRGICFRRGTLFVEVDDPALVFHFRRQYLFLLRQHLGEVLPRAGVLDIRFQSAAT